jgi:hypothetical protein
LVGGGSAAMRGAIRGLAGRSVIFNPSSPVGGPFNKVKTTNEVYSLL